MTDSSDVAPTTDGEDGERGDTGADDAGGLSPARFVLSMVVSVVVTFALVGTMAWGVWSLLPSPFGLAGAVILLGGALLGNALVVRKNYARWQRAQSGEGAA